MQPVLPGAGEMLFCAQEKIVRSSTKPFLPPRAGPPGLGQGCRGRSDAQISLLAFPGPGQPATFPL